MLRKISHRRTWDPSLRQITPFLPWSALSGLPSGSPLLLPCLESASAQPQPLLCLSIHLETRIPNTPAQPPNHGPCGGLLLICEGGARSRVSVLRVTAAVKLLGLLPPLDADSAHTKEPSRFLSFTKVPFLRRQAPAVFKFQDLYPLLTHKLSGHPDSV